MTTRTRPGLFQPVPVFFLGIAALFVFGDAKQSVTDVLDYLVVLAVWLVFVRQHRGPARRPLPRGFHVAWAAVFVAALLSAAFSVSRGYSLTWVARLSVGYIAYSLFAELSTDRVVERFLRWLLACTGIASLLFVATLLFPGAARLLPPMNLLSLSYGHSNIAGLLIFATPAYWYAIKALRHPLREVAVSLYAVLLVLTLARGAWFLVIFYLLYDLWRGKAVMPHAARALLVAATVVIVLVVGTLFVRTAGILGPLSAKNQTIISRVSYWAQAVQAFAGRPILGTGPGTFTLDSARLTTNGQPSWFAHSAPLELAAELGIVGLSAAAWLFWVHAKRMYLERGSWDAASRALASGVVLLGVYALFEYILDFYVMWLLVSAAVGLLVGRLPRSAPRRALGVVPLLAVAGVFYGLWSLGAVASYTGKPVAAFYLAPFDTTYTLRYLGGMQSKPADGIGENFAVWMHGGDSEVRFARALLYAARNDDDHAESEFAYTLSLAPNFVIHKLTYFDFLYTRSRISSLRKALSRWGSTWLSDPWVPRLYGLGLDAVDRGRLADARPFWRAATEINPSWSQLWGEYAALLWALGDRTGALAALSSCSADRYAGTHCRELTRRFTMGNPAFPGVFRNEILMGRSL